MKITIAERLHPFSHRAGTKFIIPGTALAAQVFPTRILFSDLDGKLEPFFIDFDFKGPLKDFTAELDLEKGMLSVFGITKEGYMRYFVIANEKGVTLTMEKTPKEKVRCMRSSPSEKADLKKGESILLCPWKGLEKRAAHERLSLGMHKSQDWELICRRLDLKEIFPLWHRLSALAPSAELPSKKTGNYLLLEACRQKIEQKEKETLFEAFENFFLATIDGVLVPRMIDCEHQGIVEDSENVNGPVLPLLTEAGKCIRSLFFQEEKGVISLLPCLPAQLHCGRMTQVITSKNAILDLEWTKKCLRTVSICSETEQEICLKFPKGIRSFRWTKARKQVETVSLDRDGKALLLLQAGKTAILDRFQS